MQQLNNSPKNSVYLTIINYIKEHSKLPIHPRGFQYYNRYVQRLKEKGIIIKKGYGVWEVKELNKQLNNSPRIVRGHGYTFKIKLPKIDRWNRRKDFLISKDIEYKEFKGFQSIVVNNNKIWLCNKSIVVYTPEDKSFYGETAEASERLVIYNLECVLKSLEVLLGVSLKINSKYQFKISKAHYGKIKDALAKQCNEQGTKVYCYYNGEGWLVIDNSLNLNELETIHPETSKKDMDRVIIPVFNDYKDILTKTGLIPLPSEIDNRINKLVSIQEYHAVNIKSHIKAIQDISLAVNELNKGVKGFRKEIKDIASQKSLKEWSI
jgi:hypothetical protein